VRVVRRLEEEDLKNNLKKVKKHTREYLEFEMSR